MFQKNKIDSLVRRASLCKKTIEPLTRPEIDRLSHLLCVQFSSDFIALNEQYSYECLYGACIEFLCLYDSRDNYSGVLNETLDYREKLKLPQRFVVLADQGDSGIILMKTQNSPDKSSPIIYCDQMDIDNIIQEKPLEYNPTIWPSFTDFFEYLVNEEEKMLEEEEKGQ